jgi:hypothetical protein
MYFSIEVNLPNSLVAKVRSQPCLKYEVRVEMSDNNEHSGLLQHGINSGLKKSYNMGLRCIEI